MEGFKKSRFHLQFPLFFTDSPDMTLSGVGPGGWGFDGFPGIGEEELELTDIELSQAADRAEEMVRQNPGRPMWST